MIIACGIRIAVAKVNLKSFKDKIYNFLVYFYRPITEEKRIVMRLACVGFWVAIDRQAFKKMWLSVVFIHGKH